MQKKPKIVVVMPAYNATRTVERTYADIPRDLVDNVILVDDASHDDTAEIAARLGIQVLVHTRNRGYGANQKTCYYNALQAGADVVVMVHADHQYDPARIPQLVEPILRGEADMMLGTRIADGKALQGGMPLWKFLANRGLTTLENLLLRQRLSDLHSGFRAYSRDLLETVPWYLNSDDFVFDTEMIVQSVACGFRLRETPVPARYFDAASSVDFPVSLRYGAQSLGVLLDYLLHRGGIRRTAPFMPAAARHWEQAVATSCFEQYPA